MSKLYKRLEALCQERNISIYRLCKDIGKRGSVLSDLNTGRKQGLSAKTLLAIAAYFDVSVGFLLGTEEQKSPATESGSELGKQLEGVDSALYREMKDLSNEQKRDVLRFVQFIKQKH
jgi:transcriptional regulator with XRE-family HTH domain